MVVAFDPLRAHSLPPSCWSSVAGSERAARATPFHGSEAEQHRAERGERARGDSTAFQGLARGKGHSAVICGAEERAGRTDGRTQERALVERGEA